VGGQHHASAAFTPRKDPVPIVLEAGWAPEPVWIGAENAEYLAVVKNNSISNKKFKTRVSECQQSICGPYNNVVTTEVASTPKPPFL
jgi:hypothetical protein